MTLQIRVPKRQLRVVAVLAVVVALGAGAGAAQSPLGAQAAPTATPLPKTTASEPAGLSPAGVAAVVPHDTLSTSDQHPEVQLETAMPPVTPIVTPLAAQGPDPQPQDPGQQGQQQEQQGEQAQTQAPPRVLGDAPLLTAAEQEALALVEQIIREEEGILMGTGFSYDPGGRRDPFRSLLAALGAVSAPTTRPFGLAGFLISEVNVNAIAQAQGQYKAMVTGPNQRAYFLEVGSQLYDGHVMEIRAGEVIFEQQVPDITGARRTRQVTKRLRTDPGGG